MKGGVHSVLKQTYWQELRDSHLTPPQFCPNNRVHLSCPRPCMVGG